MLAFGRFGWTGIIEFSKNKSESADEIVQSIVWNVSEWASKMA